jgi:hypothetical protein
MSKKSLGSIFNVSGMASKEQENSTPIVPKKIITGSISIGLQAEVLIFISDYWRLKRTLF